MESESINDNDAATNEQSTTDIKYKGVYKCGVKFKAQIQIERVQHYLGIFDSEIEAAVAYDNHAKILLGNRARTNFEYNEDQADPNLSRQLIDTQKFSISRMEANINETHNLPPKRKRGYASIQDRPPLDSLTSLEILAVKPKRERNVVERSLNKKKNNNISMVSTANLIEAASIISGDSTTPTNTGSISNSRVTMYNMSDHNGAIHVVSTDTSNTNSETNETSCANTTVNLHKAAAIAALSAAVTASTAAVPVCTGTITDSTPTVTTNRPETEGCTMYMYNLGKETPLVDPASIRRASADRASTYWAGVLYIDPVSELQMWKGTYVECSDSTTRPTPAAFTTTNNVFEYNILPDPNASFQAIASSDISTHTTPVTSDMTANYCAVVIPQSGRLLGSYYSSTTMTSTASSFELVFEPLTEPEHAVCMRYSAFGSGTDTGGKFIVCGVYSCISRILELRRLNVKE